MHRPLQRNNATSTIDQASVRLVAHAKPSAEIIAAFATDTTRGLNSAEAATRLTKDGPNALIVREGPSRFELAARQFASLLVWILLVAAGVSGFVLGEYIDMAVILAVVVLNAILGYVQEAKAENALAALRELTTQQARVLRDGNESKILAADLVAGDVIILEAGSAVPADARLVTTQTLSVNEASITGESFPSLKDAAPVAADCGLGDQHSMVFMGTGVEKGRGLAVVTATGMATEMGHIASLLDQQDEQKTPLQTELDRLGRILILIAFVVALLVFILGLLRGSDAESIFLLAVAVAVAAIPEGLSAVVTITLANGVQTMAEKSAIIRRLPAVEALGSTTVICTDKTGTLTKNEIRVEKLATERGVTSLSDATALGPIGARLSQIAALCNDADLVAAIGNDPTETALLLASESFGSSVVGIRAEAPRIAEAPFDSDRMSMSTLHNFNGAQLLAVKGAPEVVLGLCRQIEGLEGPEPLRDEHRNAMQHAIDDFAADGYRTLALAYRSVTPPQQLPNGDSSTLEHDLVLIAITAMRDEIRPDVPPAVDLCHRAGIQVVLITGDHVATATAVARDTHILLDGQRSLAGRELHSYSASRLASEVGTIGVYARVNPSDKVKVVKAWQAQGELVAMTGDGVNDAPALRAADIGIAMGTGTDVAKDASDMVLTDDNFATIAAAVAEGRRIYANLQKVVYFLMSSNLSEILVILLAVVAFGHLGEPLLATQILWINLITDGLPVIALGLDDADEGLMDQPPIRERSFIKAGFGRLIVSALIMAAASIAALVYGHYVREFEWERVQTLVFTTLIVVQLGQAINLHAGHQTVFRPDVLRGNRLLVLGIAISLGLQIAVVHLTPGQWLFDTVSLDLIDWTVILALFGLCLVGLDLVKRFTPHAVR